MGTNWVLNMAGLRLGETDMATIHHPKTELTVHVTTKTVQAGGVLGSLLVAPTLTALQGPRNLNTLKSKMETCGRYGVFLGLVAGPLMTWQRLNSTRANYASVWDRCYRLRYNRNQVRVDQLSFVGAVAGFTAAHYLNDSGALGAIVGMSGGCIFAAFLNTVM